MNATTEAPVRPDPRGASGDSHQIDPATAERWPRWARPFLAAFAIAGVVTAAAKYAKTSRQQVYRLRDSDPDFARAFGDAREQAIDALELEAVKLALGQAEEPVIHKGRPCFVWKDAAGNIVAEGTPGAERRPLTTPRRSDALLMLLLRARRPDVYGHKASLEFSGSGPFRPAEPVAEGDLFERLERLAGVFAAAAVRIPEAGEGAQEVEALPQGTGQEPTSCRACKRRPVTAGGGLCWRCRAGA